MTSAARSDAYPDTFYDLYQVGSGRSAEAVLDALAGLGVGPWQRVVDVGCGRGAWLRACVERGASTAVGIDGPWNAGAFDPSGPVRFQGCDLAHASRDDLAGLVGAERFDAAICVEALEHMNPVAGSLLVEALVGWSDLVVFSAAIPGQGGRGHQNEQWQSHWAREFAKHGYDAYDLVRPMMWDRPDVEPWYRQNILVYAPAPPVRGLQAADLSFIDYVHPDVFSTRRLQLSGSELAHSTRQFANRCLQGARRRLRP